MTPRGRIRAAIQQLIAGHESDLIGLRYALAKLDTVPDNQLDIALTVLELDDNSALLDALDLGVTK
jgi:hypothetical protein